MSQERARPQALEALHTEAERVRKDQGWQNTVLVGLNDTGKHIYEGTVAHEERRRRHARTKQARKARRNNR